MTSLDRIVKGAVEKGNLEQELTTAIGGLVPRPDQIDTARAAVEWLSSPSPKGKVIEIPTGGGKTLVAQMVIRWLIAKTQGIDVAFLVSRKELMTQTQNAIEKSFGRRSVNITQGSKHTNHAGSRVRVLMEQTIASKIKKGTASHVVRSIEKAGVVFIDECHHTYYQSFIDRVLENGGRVIGLSATPDDWKLLQWFEQTKILGVPQITLETATPRVLATPVMLFYSQEGMMAKATAGLTSEEEKEKVRYGLVRDTIGAEIRSAENRVYSIRADKGLPALPTISLRWLVKVTRVAHAQDLAEHLTNAGIPAQAFVSGQGGGTKDEIDRIFAGKSHKRVAIVVHRFTVGYDHPGIQGLIFTNETGYPSFVQSVGRVLRTGYPPAKDEAYILDMAGNWALHKSKYMERRTSPSKLIPVKLELEKGDGLGRKDGPGRPDAKILGHMAVLTLPGIQNTDYAAVDKAVLLAWCGIEATEHLKENYHYLSPEVKQRMQYDPTEWKKLVLKRALTSYWFMTGQNIVPRGTYEMQSNAANEIIYGNLDAVQIWNRRERMGMPIEIKKRLHKARRKFSKQKRTAQ